MTTIESISIKDILNTQYKEYSYYVLESRAIPSVIDGLKPVVRRGLWHGTKMAKDWVKVSKLAGATMATHPHGNTSIESAISSCAQSFAGANNICWFEGKGAFGSRITGPGNGIGAARYVSVKLSESFYIILDVDRDLITKVPNYDDTEQEPKHFLPLVPAVLLNPTQGIAVGYACNILPRKLSDIVHCQNQHLQGKGFREPSPYYEGFKGTIEKTGDKIWLTTGVFERKSKKKIIITELPIGQTRESYIRVLDALEDRNVITSFTDDCTDEFLFTINLKNEMTDDEIIEKFKLTSNLNENINIIGFDGKIRSMTVTEIIKEFTDFRFSFYLKRFKKQFNELKDQFEFERDLLKVIQKGLFKKFPDLKKDEIKQLLLDNDIQEKNLSRIIQTPIYKFGKDEIEVLKKKLLDLKKNLENLVKLCKDENLRRNEYIKELKTIK